tara:strand:+ start:128 stop:517 length:390 start_codon:yes stop_codon:yes gene_type:complete
MSTSSRDQSILKLRAEIPSIENLQTTTDVEVFQNNTLRPILKFQNDALIHTFLLDLKSKKQDLKTLNTKQRQLLIDNHFRINSNLRQVLLGMVLALFSSDEMRLYNSVYKELNKRIFSLLKARLKDQLV